MVKDEIVEDADDDADKKLAAELGKVALVLFEGPLGEFVVLDSEGAAKACCLENLCGYQMCADITVIASKSLTRCLRLNDVYAGRGAENGPLNCAISRPHRGSGWRP